MLSPAVLKNIIDYYSTFSGTNNYIVKRQFPFVSSRSGIIAVASGALACAVTLFAIYSMARYENVPIHAVRVKGLVKADSSILKKGEPIKPRANLTTAENSKLAITHDSIMKLIAGPDTTISIKKSYIERASGKRYFEIVVDRGTIIAIFERAGNLEYSFITPHGRIRSRGSTIAIKVNSSKTHVLVKVGLARLTSLQGKSTDSENGIGYYITPVEVTLLTELPDGENSTAELLDITRYLTEDEDVLFE